jgi:regulator of sigma E protease
MGILTQILQLLLSLSILVIFHEFGHFAFAKIFKTRVEKFYLFFDPWFSLFKIKYKDTEYGMGWLPLGGYVKISGMIDESMDKEQLKQPEQPWEFRAKPAWQRLLIMLGGVLVNFILAALIYIAILYTWGEEYIPNQNVKYGIHADSTAHKLGFQDGDKILSINDKDIVKFDNIMSQIILDPPQKVKIDRNDSMVEISIEKSDINTIIEAKSRIIEPRFSFKIAAFSKDSNAKKAGLEIGDLLVKLNGKELKYYDEYSKYLKSNPNKKVKISVLRNGDTIDYEFLTNKEGMIGVQPVAFNEIDFNHQDYTFFESFPAGIKKGKKMTIDYFKQLKLIFSPETGAYKSVGSFVTIGNMFSKSWDWFAFWTMTAFLSIILGVMNLLPIPALDGGHVVFVLYEMITGRKPGDKFLEYAQITGFVILILIMVYALKNDFVNYIF